MKCYDRGNGYRDTKLVNVLAGEWADEHPFYSSPI
jgi:hypothetical protein